MSLQSNWVNPQMCREAAKLLLGAFSWEDSPDGHEYWRKVHSKLEALANEAERQIEAAEKEKERS